MQKKWTMFKWDNDYSCFFHISGFKSLKKFYIFLHCYHRKEFPNLLSYKRFLVLEKRCFFPLFAFFNFVSAICDGESFIDSTALPICHIKREYVNKVFANMAKKSKSTMGWFLGFKLHLITNVLGHPISFTVTKDNVDDRKVPQSLFSKIFGKIYGDKGYRAPCKAAHILRVKVPLWKEKPAPSCSESWSSEGNDRI